MTLLTAAITGSCLAAGYITVRLMRPTPPCVQALHPDVLAMQEARHIQRLELQMDAALADRRAARLARFSARSAASRKGIKQSKVRG